MTKQIKRYQVFDTEGKHQGEYEDQTKAEAIADAFNGIVIMTIPHQIILVDHIPTCNFCEAPGEYDFKSKYGPWANACEKHWKQNRQSAKLGTGFGQKWILRPNA